VNTGLLSVVLSVNHGLVQLYPLAVAILAGRIHHAAAILSHERPVRVKLMRHPPLSKKYIVLLSW